MVARSGQDNDLVVGIESYKPEYRKGLAKTVRPMDKVDKVGSPKSYNIKNLPTNWFEA